MHVLRPWPALALVLASLSIGGPAAGDVASLGPAALRAEYASLGQAKTSGVLSRTLSLKSQEQERRAEVDLYAVLDYPFATVKAALSDPTQWCDVLILHLNNKQCRPETKGTESTLTLRVGKTWEQKAEQAAVLRFNWRMPEERPDYLAAQMAAPVGPYDTQDYKLYVEAVPVDGNRTFLHLAYSLGYGPAGLLALNVYFGTSGRDKVGFSPVEPVSAKSAFVGGVRGLVERNTMRYFLAIDAYLQALSAPPAERLERRMEAWFDATEKYPRQLHEIGRAEYLRMKRGEVQQQALVR